MQWWNDFSQWLVAADTRPVLFTATVVFVAVLVAGVLAAWISRGAVGQVLAQRDREQRAAAVAALVDAATESSVWNSLTPPEQVLSDRAVGQADVLVRLLPMRGAEVAANWASHQLRQMKRSSATFGYDLEPAVVGFRDRLVQWQRKPSRARKVFAGDLAEWSAHRDRERDNLDEQQAAWVADRHHDRYAEQTTASSDETMSDSSTATAATAAQPTAPSGLERDASTVPTPYSMNSR